MKKNIIFVLIIFIGLSSLSILYLSFIKDKGLCSNIKNESELVKCYANLAIDNDDPSFCQKISKKLILNCYQVAASISNNWDYCDYIKEDEWQSNCIYTVSFKTNPPKRELCDRIRNITTKGFCLRELANEKKDVTVCNEIEDIIEREYCFDNLAENAIQVNTTYYLEKTRFDCSVIFSKCDSGEWIKNNILGVNKNYQKVSDYCNKLCANVSRRFGGYNTSIENTIIRCICK